LKQAIHVPDHGYYWILF